MPKTDEKKKKPSGSRAEITVEGEVPEDTAARLLRQAGDDPQPAQERKAFAKAIRDPDVRIIARRTMPSMTEEGTPLGDEYELFSHDDMTEAEIKTELAQNRGGQRWHIRCEDKETGHQLCAKTVVVGGEPKLDPIVEQLDSPSRRGGGYDPEFEEPESADAQVAKRIALDPEIVEARKQEELYRLKVRRFEMETAQEEMEARREEARTRRDRARRGILEGEHENGNGRKGGELDVKEIIAEATQPLQDEIKRLNAERERRDSDQALDRRFESTLGPLKSMIEAQQRTLEKLSEGPREDRFDKMLEAMNNGFNNLKDSLKADPSKTMADAIKDMGTTLGTQINQLQSNLAVLMKGNGNDAATTALINLATKQPAGGAATDPFTMMDKTVGAMKTLMEVKTGLEGKSTTEVMPPDFPSYLVAKTSELATPVLDFLDRQASRGEKATKEMLEKFLREHGLKMYQELDGTLKKEVREGMHRIQLTMLGGQQQAQQAGIPAPAQPPAPAPGPATATAPAGSVPSPVPAPPQSAAPPQGPPQITAPAPGLGTREMVDKDIRERVNSVLQIVLQEMQIGAERMEWPEHAFNDLPKDVRDRIVTAAEDTHIYEAVKPHADPALLDQIWAYLSDSHKDHQWYRDWMLKGIEWIRAAATGNLPSAEDEQ